MSIILFLVRWVFHTEKEMDGYSDRAQLMTYPGSGYYTDLTRTRARTYDILAELKENRWIDRGTRVVYLDFTVYNPNINLFCVAKYVPRHVCVLISISNDNSNMYV